MNGARNRTGPRYELTGHIEPSRLYEGRRRLQGREAVHVDAGRVQRQE